MVAFLSPVLLTSSIIVMAVVLAVVAVVAVVVLVAVAAVVVVMCSVISVEVKNVESFGVARCFAKEQFLGYVNQ